LLIVGSNDMKIAKLSQQIEFAAQESRKNALLVSQAKLLQERLDRQTATETALRAQLSGTSYHHFAFNPIHVMRHHSCVCHPK
jgi:hypothetical protein